MKTLPGFALVAVVVIASLTGCSADPALATGAAFPGPRGPGLSAAPGPFTAGVVEKTASVERVRETRERETRSDERPIARRPRSGCPSCD